MTEIR